MFRDEHDSQGTRISGWHTRTAVLCSAAGHSGRMQSRRNWHPLQQAVAHLRVALPDERLQIGFFVVMEYSKVLDLLRMHSGRYCTASLREPCMLT